MSDNVESGLWIHEVNRWLVFVLPDYFSRIHIVDMTMNRGTKVTGTTGIPSPGQAEVRAVLIKTLLHRSWCPAQDSTGR